MTDLAGTIWDFNANGSPGSLTIFEQDPAGQLRLDVVFDGLDRTDPWSGAFDDAAKQITLVRQLPGQVTQTHLGYLGDNDPGRLIFGGSFTESDIPRPGRTEFGWFAIFRSTLIP